MSKNLYSIYVEICTKDEIEEEGTTAGYMSNVLVFPNPVSGGDVVFLSHPEHTFQVPIKVEKVEHEPSLTRSVEKPKPSVIVGASNISSDKTSYLEETLEHYSFDFVD